MLNETDPLKKLFAEVNLLVEGMWDVNKVIAPMAFVVHPGGRHAMRLTWSNQMEKEFEIAALKSDMKAIGATKYALINEAWLTFPVVGSDLKTPPSRRREVVTIHAEEIGGRQMFAWREIQTETRRGKIVRTLGALEMTPSTEQGGEIKGAMGKLLEN